MQRARLRFPDAEMGEMIYDGRGIDGVLIREAGTCQFMESASNVVICYRQCIFHHLHQ